MTERCPYYQGVCGIDERYVCYAAAGPKCNIREDYEKKLNEATQKQYKPTEQNINSITQTDLEQFEALIRKSRLLDKAEIQTLKDGRFVITLYDNIDEVNITFDEDGNIE